MNPAPARLLLPLAAAGAAGGLVAVLVLLEAIPLPDLDGALEEASGTLGGWAYPAVAGLALLETGAFVGLAVPGETAVVVGGVVAASGEVELLPLIGLVALAAAAGDLVSFVLGRRLGRPFLERHGPRLRLGPERLARVERFYDRHGGKAVFLGRFTGLVRAVSPFIAGTSGLAARRFVLWSAAGALSWAATFTLVGYGFSESFAESGEAAARIALAAALVAALGLSLVALRRSRPAARPGGHGEAAEPQRGEDAECAQGGAEQRDGGHFERDVHAQSDARQSDGGRRRGDRQAPAPQVGAKPKADQQRTLDPPGGDHYEDRGEPAALEGRSAVDEHVLEIEQPGDHRSRPARDRLLVAVNGRASGIDDPLTTALGLVAVLEELGARADGVVTGSEEELWEVMRRAAAEDRRVVLAGGDGTLHAAANAPLRRLPELALVPAGRANNTARALGIPTTRTGALAVAASMAARPLDALRVATPDRIVYALEALSAGFHAEARGGYDADNSSDLRQGLRALLAALRRFHPYHTVLRLPDGELRSRSTAQILLSNLPYFGFGFEVNPGADPADGRFEAIVFETRSRRRLVRLLLAARRGRHLGRSGVRRVPATRARLTEPLPLVADALPLGTTTATVTVEPERLRVAFPNPGVES